MHLKCTKYRLSGQKQYEYRRLNLLDTGFGIRFLARRIVLDKSTKGICLHEVEVLKQVHQVHKVHQVHLYFLRIFATGDP